MGGIVIDIWEESNFFGSFLSQKGAKNVILKAPPYGRVNLNFIFKVPQIRGTIAIFWYG